MHKPFRKPWTKADTKRSLDFMAAAADKPIITGPGGPIEITIRPKRQRAEKRRVTASEHQEQSAVISWWGRVHQQYHLPEFALFAIPNGGARDVITGARLKAEGVRPGVLDLMLACTDGQHAGLFLEMKVGDNKPSEKQKAFIEYLERAGYQASVHWDSASAIKAIQDYLGEAPFDAIRRFLRNAAISNKEPTP